MLSYLSDGHTGRNILCEIFRGHYFLLFSSQLRTSPTSITILQFIQLVSDLGGNTGLWVGFCVLTIVEWLVLLINIGYICCCGGDKKGKKSGRTSPSTEKQNGNFDSSML